MGIKSESFFKKIIYSCLVLAYIQNLYIFLAMFRLDDILKFDLKILAMIAMFAILSGFVVIVPFVSMIIFYPFFLRFRLVATIVKTCNRFFVRICPSELNFFYFAAGASVLIDIISLISPDMNMASSVILGVLYAVFINKVCIPK